MHVRTGWITAIALLAGCAHPYLRTHKADVDGVLATYATPKNRRVEQPGVADGKPWNVGAWALYQHGTDGYLMISVVAEDTCGVVNP